MSWADCGNDSQGRPIGYAYEATCDHPGCAEKIDRGLAYVCGSMHGSDDVSCERYFCDAHRSVFVVDARADRECSVCEECRRSLLESEEWIEDEDEGVLKRKEGA